jgi:two-component system, OmpR family, phosphate regulon sensor histidine kinase PhoR
MNFLLLMVLLLLLGLFIHTRRKLKYSLKELSQRTLELETILNSALGGVVAVDTKNRITLMNSTAIEMFNMKKKNILGEDILLTIRHLAFNDFLRQYKKDIKKETQQVMDFPHNQKYYRVYLSHIQNPEFKEKSNGLLMIIQDITNVRKLEQMRSDFVSNVTHELKTPLTSIQGFIETLKNGAMKNPKVLSKFLDIIDIEADRLSLLISDILQLSEIETMKEDVRIECFKVSEILNEVLFILKPSTQKKKIEISWKMDDAIHFVCMNKDRLKQILINLVDNAIKYTDQGGRISISFKKQEYKMVEIIVNDNGIGISKEHLPRIFERFYRVDKGRSRNEGGTGLGLSIVKHIVQLYQGDLEAHSESGKGTWFVIRLPISKDP